MNGVTGRMGTNQHLIRSILAIRAQGGVTLANGDRVMPDPILIGRNAEKIEALAEAHGVERWRTDLDAALANKNDEVFFDAGTTQMRPDLARAGDRRRQARLLREADRDDAGRGARASASSRESAGVKHGVVQDKLFLPGLRKLDMLRDAGFFGRMLSRARRVRLLGVRGRPAADPAAVVELPQPRTAAASSSTCCATGATCSTTCSAR